MSRVTDDEDVPTTELPVGTTNAAEAPAVTGGGRTPAVAGVVLSVLWIMGIGMVTAQVISAAQHVPGPGPVAVGVHVAAAVVGVLCYRATSRHRGLPRLIGLLVLLAVVVGLLWYFWWSPAR